MRAPNVWMGRQRRRTLDGWVMGRWAIGEVPLSLVRYPPYSLPLRYWPLVRYPPHLNESVCHHLLVLSSGACFPHLHACMMMA